MRILVTGSAGHLGEALMRSVTSASHEAIGTDLKPSPFTHKVGSITDRDFIDSIMSGIDAVFHTATLHKPHVATHGRQDFIDTNVTGTLNLLEAAVAGGVKAFVFTSTTSAFGAALVPPPGDPAAWITEEVRPVPKNIYGVTKTAAEDLCALVQRDYGLPCLVLRTSRFFPEKDDSPEARSAYEDTNLKTNEFLFRRVDIEDVVTAHFAALARAAELGFERYIISATTPFEPDDLAALRSDMPSVVTRLAPEYQAIYAAKNWTMFPAIDRVYVNARARQDLDWRPRYDFATILAQVSCGEPLGSPLSRLIGSKGYHDVVFDDGPYPVASV